MTLRRIIPTRIIPRWGKIAKFLESGIPNSDLPDDTISSFEELEKDDINPQELVDIINLRLKPGRQDAISAVFGDPDFLPFPFLEKGIQCGAAICRLVRQVNDEDLDSLIKDIIKAEEELGEQFTPEEVARIFNIEERAIFLREFPTSSMLENQDKRQILQALMRVIELRESKIQIRIIPYGTGFLVGRNYLLTNHHVIENKSEAKKFLAEFGYEQDKFGRNIEPIPYELDNSFFYTNEELDYTLIKVKEDCATGGLKGYAGDHFGWLPLLEDSKVIAPSITKKEADKLGITQSLLPEIQERLQMPSFPAALSELSGESEMPASLGVLSRLPGEPVNIIQHPKGKRKEIVLSNNRVRKISRNFLYYDADADFSSSGSPVLNQQWQLVGLHHAAVTVEYEEKEGEQLIKKWQVVGQEGVRICQIVKDLKNTETRWIDASNKLINAADIADDFAELIKAFDHIKALAKEGIPLAGKGRIGTISTRERVIPLEEELIQLNPIPRLSQFQKYKEDFCSQAKECIKQFEEILKNTGEISGIIVQIDNWITQGFEELSKEAEELRKEASRLEETASNLKQEFIKPFVIEDKENLSEQPSDSKDRPPAQTY